MYFQVMHNLYGPRINIVENSYPRVIQHTFIHSGMKCCEQNLDMLYSNVSVEEWSGVCCVSFFKCSFLFFTQQLISLSTGYDQGASDVPVKLILKPERNVCKADPRSCV